MENGITFEGIDQKDSIVDCQIPIDHIRRMQLSYYKLYKLKDEARVDYR